MNSDLQLRIDTLVEKWGFHGTICIAKEGQVVAQGAYGLADRENNIAFGEGTNCYIASVTKQFTAACVMMLYEKKLLDIEDTLDKYIPEYSRGKEITLRQLLNMRSGIPHELTVIEQQVMDQKEQLGLSERDFEIYCIKACAPEKCSFSDFLKIVDPLPLDFVPGEKYVYSDTNYMFLGEIVGRVSGSTIGEFMEKHIFQPLGMNHTVFGADQSEALSYGVFEGERVCLGRAHFKTGDGAICTTAQDITKWLTAVLEGKLLKKSSWKLCFKMVEGYGFGWEKQDNWYLHSGGDLGYSSVVYINFEMNVSIAIIGNEQVPSGDRLDDYSFNRNIRRVVTGEFITIKKPKLEKINLRNLTDVISMRTTNEQKAFVAPNYLSIAQAYADSSRKAYLISDNGVAVGFMLLEVNKRKNIYEIVRLLIDERFQKKGYGEAAVHLGIDKLRKFGATHVTIAYVPNNIVAEKLYMRLGFTPDGKSKYDENQLRMEITK